MIGKSMVLRFGLALIAAWGVGIAAYETRAAQSGTADSDLAFAMSVEVGRLETMVARAEDTADILLSNQVPSEPANLAQYDNTTIQNLKTAILRYNLLVVTACDADRPNREFCGEPYLPDWLRAPASTRYGRDRMQAMIREANSKIAPFWNAVCARGRTATQDARFCELE